MQTLHRDVETRSTLDLRDVGAWRYSLHPTTDVWCVAFAINDEPIKLWVPGDPVPAEFVEAAQNQDWFVSSFNNQFERLIERHILAPRYGFPLVPIERHRCTQAAALALALPAKLETVAPVLKLDAQKDEAGHRVMMRMSRPRQPRCRGHERRHPSGRDRGSRQPEDQIQTTDVGDRRYHTRADLCGARAPADRGRSLGYRESGNRLA